MFLFVYMVHVFFSEFVCMLACCVLIGVRVYACVCVHICVCLSLSLYDVLSACLHNICVKAYIYV